MHPCSCISSCRNCRPNPGTPIGVDPMGWRKDQGVIAFCRTQAMQVPACRDARLVNLFDTIAEARCQEVLAYEHVPGQLVVENGPGATIENLLAAQQSLLGAFCSFQMVEHFQRGPTGRGGRSTLSAEANYLWAHPKKRVPGMKRLGWQHDNPLPPTFVAQTRFPNVDTAIIHRIRVGSAYLALWIHPEEIFGPAYTAHQVQRGGHLIVASEEPDLLDHNSPLRLESDEWVQIAQWEFEAPKPFLFFSAQELVQPSQHVAWWYRLHGPYAHALEACSES